MQNALVVKDLTKTYGTRTAVDHLAVTVKKGEVFGLLGHNGAGKSTSIECILGVKKADSGTAQVLGMNPKTQRKALFQKVGVQFQQSNFQEKITVEELCKMTASLYRQPADWTELLPTFGLQNLQKSAVMDCSGGERQRLCVLLALIPRPEMVFLDELTTGLDTKARRDVWRYLTNLKKDGLTVVLTSHYMDEVEALCDRVCILDHGRVLIQGTPEELVKNSPYDRLEEAYLWYTGEED